MLRQRELHNRLESSCGLPQGSAEPFSKGKGKNMGSSQCCTPSKGLFAPFPAGLWWGKHNLPFPLQCQRPSARLTWMWWYRGMGVIPWCGANLAKQGEATASQGGTFLCSCSVMWLEGSASWMFLIALVGDARLQPGTRPLISAQLHG